MALPTDAQERKGTPIYSGVLKYFPDAIAEVARVSKAGNDQHNPGQPMHWAREKSKDHHDCIVRHLIDAGTLDSDGLRHSAKVAWRALAALQLELEEAQGMQDYDGWIVADPNYPPGIHIDMMFDSGNIRRGYVRKNDWAMSCTDMGDNSGHITHWRPSKES